MYVPKRPACLALASAGAVLKSGQRLLLETESEVNTKSAQPHRVLVVGAGLTGSLTAALLRRDWPNENPPLHLTVWERATYPAGRFGAKMTLENDVADLGAQVLSIVDTDSDHTDAGDGGHGISCAAVILAKKEARRLLSSGLLVQAEDGGLGETEERMLWEGIWRHYHAPLGLVSVLKEYLREAKLDCFATERKVESISYVPSQTNLCWGVHASQRSNKTSSSQSSIVNDAFHSVVVCVPAPDALDIQGVKDVFTEDSVEILQGVGYDSRYSIAVFYAYELYSQVARMFNGRSEISLDVDTGSDDAQHGLHLMIFQGAKSGRSTQKYVAIVAHTTPKLGQTNIDAQDLVHRVHNIISDKIGMSESDLQQLTRGSKVIDWKVSQMVRPAESIVTRWKPDVACLTSSEAFSGKVVITGDFLSQSSYLGCLTAALDARDAVLQSASKH